MAGMLLFASRVTQSRRGHRLPVFLTTMRIKGCYSDAGLARGLVRERKMSYHRSRSPRYMRSGVLRSASTSRYAYDRSHSPRILPRSDLYDLGRDDVLEYLNDDQDYIYDRSMSLDRRSLSRHRSLAGATDDRIREYVAAT